MVFVGVVEPRNPVSTNDRDLDEAQGGGIAPIKDFLASLTIMLQSRFIDETNSSEKLSLLWIQHPSAVLACPAPSKDPERILMSISSKRP